MVALKSITDTDLKKSFENGELQLYYQPQVDVSDTPVIVAYEALARWPQKDRSYIPPDIFIAMAERTGLILEIDSWAIETVCTQLASMQSDPHTQGMRIAANVSTQKFRDQHFARLVSDILTKTAVDPACLTIEISERAVLDQGETTHCNIHALHEMGVSLSLDDFGMGYSSLFHLKTLPIDEIKIDRGFISGLPDDARDAVIVSSVIDIAKGLGIRFIAEGVELPCQAEWLRSKGCLINQGFLYGRPAPKLRSSNQGAITGYEAEGRRVRNR